jgi:hypothetical protein
MSVSYKLLFYADEEIILTLLGSWHFDTFSTSKCGKICIIHADFEMWETSIDYEE